MQVYRICKPAPFNYTTSRNMALFPRIFASELAPIFRVFDEALTTVPRHSYRQTVRSFQPRFDVKENTDSYELQGEFPGFESRDISIEFSDQQVLSIKGRQESHRQEGNQASKEIEAPAEQSKPAERAESDAASYQKPSVEEDWETNMAGANPDPTPAATPAETPAAGSSVVEAETQQVAQAPKTDGSRYWVSERSVGSFARTFKFPNRVDQENVKASLKNGILSVVVPKAAQPASRRINIE